MPQGRPPSTPRRGARIWREDGMRRCLGTGLPALGATRRVVPAAGLGRQGRLRRGKHRFQTLRKAAAYIVDFLPPAVAGLALYIDLAGKQDSPDSSGRQVLRIVEPVDGLGALQRSLYCHNVAVPEVGGRPAGRQLCWWGRVDQQTPGCFLVAVAAVDAGHFQLEPDLPAGRAGIGGNDSCYEYLLLVGGGQRLGGKSDGARPAKRQEATGRRPPRETTASVGERDRDPG